MLTSSNGISWTSRTSGTSRYFIGLTFEKNNFIAVGYSILFTSLDGLNWSSKGSKGDLTGIINSD